MSVKGERELVAYFNALPTKLQKGAGRAMVTAAAKVIRTEARHLVPKDTGKLAKAIRSSSSKVNKDGTVSIRVFVDRKKPHGWLGPMVEHGIAPHDITITPGKVAQLGDEFVSGTISHPGVAKRPFLRPAFDTTQDEAVKAMQAKLQQYLKGKTGITIPLEDDE